MPRNGSGEYSLPYNWNDDKSNGIKVLASRMQSQDQDIANALTASISADGQTAYTGNQDYNGNRAVDLADGQDSQDAAVIRQVQTGELQYYGISSTILSGIAGKDYEVNASPTLTEYVNGLNFTFLTHVNCLDNPVLRVDTRPQLQMVKDDGAGGYINLIAGDILQNHVYDCVYNEVIGLNKILIKNPEREQLGIDNLVVNKTIASNVFSSKKVTIANNVSDPNNDIDFSAGSSFDVTNNVGFFLGSGLTKRLDANWVVGTGQGGLDTGSKANSTWYYCYAIYNPASNTTDAIFSTNASAPSLPSGYTRYKRAGAIYTNSSGNITVFDQVGNKFIYQTLIQDYSIIPASTTKTDVTTTVPPNTFGIYSFLVTTVGDQLFYIRGFKQSAIDLTPDNTNSQFAVQASGSGDQVSATAYLELPANSSSQISYRASAASEGIFYIRTEGFIDPNL
jgi:hypothetical protein